MCANVPFIDADTGLYLVFVATYGYLSDAYGLCESSPIAFLLKCNALTLANASSTSDRQRRLICTGCDGVLSEPDGSILPPGHACDVRELGHSRKWRFDRRRVVFLSLGTVSGTDSFDSMSRDRDCPVVDAVRPLSLRRSIASSVVIRPGNRRRQTARPRQRKMLRGLACGCCRSSSG